MAAQVNDPYATMPDPATTDLSAANFGSAFSSPGSLSSTNLATSPATSGDFSALNDPNYFTSGGSSAPPMSGAPASVTQQPAPTAGAPAAPSSGGNWWSGLGSTLGSLAPSLIAGGIGLNQAKGAQKQSDAFAAQLTALGGPYTAAGQQLLKQFQSGQIRPDQTAVSNLATSQGQNLIDSGTGLSAIAQSAYKDYQAGKLPPADEQRLSDQTAAQKQEMRQRLSQQGITDSSILAGYDQQIENQSNINRQDLLDKRFATGNTAYDQWLKSTSEGQKLKLEGAQFASQSLDNMLNESLLLGSEGMAPITQAIQLQLEQNAALSGQVQQLMGNLAGAYAYQKAGSGGPGGGPSWLGTAQSGLNLATKVAGGQQQPAPSGGGGYTSGLGTGTSAPTNAFDPNFFNPSVQTPIDTGASTPTSDFSALNNPNYFTDTSTITPTTTAGPSSAGGVAAGSTGSTAGTALGYAGGALGVYRGLSQGGALGDAKAGIAATQLASKAGLVSKGANAVAGDLGNVLGIYSGLKQGGAAGYSGAAVNAAQLGSKAGAFGASSGAVGAAAGYAAVPLALYGEIKSWQSGATASDALSGAETGAAVGSIVPGVGTLIGAVIGGALGAISSVFGSGKKGAAAGSWDQLTKSDALKSTPGRNFDEKSWGEAFKGMLDEGNNIFAGGGSDRHKDPDALAKPLEAQVKSAMSKLGPNATTDQVYNQAIVPWMQSTSSGLDWNVLQNEPTQQAMIRSAVDRVLAGEPIVRSEMSSYSPTPDLQQPVQRRQRG